MRSTFLIVGVIALAVAGYYGYSKFSAPAPTKQAAAKPQGPVQVEVARVALSDLKVALNTVGTLKANESLMLKPEITGRIESIPAAEGSSVKKGELLVAIDDRVFAAELKQAEAALNLARVNYARAKLLKEKGVGTVSNYDNTAANLRVAQAQVDLTRATLDKTRIVAPFDGVMGLRHVSPGDVVNPGQDLASFQSKNPIKADFTLPESATRVVSVGQPIDVVVDAFPDRTFTGKVYAIDPQIDATSRNIMLRALIPNDDGVLQPGLFARISLITSHVQGAIMVPESAIVPRGQQSFVLVVGQDNKVSNREITTGERMDGMVQITGGLGENETVVTAGHLKLREGSEVSYMLPTGEGAGK